MIRDSVVIAIRFGTTSPESAAVESEEAFDRAEVGRLRSRGVVPDRHVWRVCARSFSVVAWHARIDMSIWWSIRGGRVSPGGNLHEPMMVACGGDANHSWAQEG